jgi:hypothetical protein
VEPEGERLLRAGNAQPGDDRGPPEGGNSGEQRNRQIAPVADRRRWHRADQQIAGNASGIGRRKRQDQNPKQIEPVPDPRHRTAQRKDKGPDEVEHQQERFHPGLSHPRPGDEGSISRTGPIGRGTPFYAASQARDAHFDRSPPVSLLW